MPCASCGRTANREWLHFYVSNSEKRFYCPFCVNDGSVKSSKDITNPISSYFNLYMKLILVIVIIITAMVYTWHSPFRNAERVNGPEPEWISNATIGDRMTFYGQINSTEDVVLYREESGSRKWVYQNFILTNDNDSLYVIVTDDTLIIRLNDTNASDDEYRSGEDVYVVGKVEEINNSIVIKAEVIRDEKYSYDRELLSFLIKNLPLVIVLLIIIIVGCLPIWRSYSVIVGNQNNTILYDHEKTFDSTTNSKQGEGIGDDYSGPGSDAVEQISTQRKHKLTWQIILVSLIGIIPISSYAFYHFLDSEADGMKFTLSLIGLITIFIIMSFYGFHFKKIIETVNTIGFTPESLLIWQWTNEPYRIVWKNIRYLYTRKETVEILTKDDIAWSLPMSNEMAKALDGHWDSLGLQPVSGGIVIEL